MSRDTTSPQFLHLQVLRLISASVTVSVSASVSISNKPGTNGLAFQLYAVGAAGDDNDMDDD